MGTNNLTDKACGGIIDETYFNDIHEALEEDFVGRNSSGVPEADQNLGTSLYPWGTAYLENLNLNGQLVDLSTFASEPFRVISGKTRSTSE